MVDTPLSYEEIWGVPEVKKEVADRHYCPYKGIKCDAWDQGCQADLCVIGREGNES